MEYNKKKFEPLLGHIVDFSGFYPDNFPDLCEWEHILEDLEEIEDTFLTIRSALDYSIPLKGRSLPNECARKKAGHLLNVSECSEVNSINFDAMHFDQEPHRVNAFCVLAKIESDLSNNRPIDKGAHKAFKAIKSNRGRNRPPVFAKKFVVLALAEYYAEKNELGNRAYIGFCQEPSETREQFSSDFLTFLDSFLKISLREHGSNSKNGSFLVSNGYAREILRRWRNRPNKLRNKKILQLSNMEEIATTLSQI